jgi:hypothetical protein
MWEHSDAESVLAMTTGLLALVLAPAAVFAPSAGRALAGVGFVLGLVNLGLLENNNLLTMAVHAACALGFIAGGFALGPKARAAEVAATITPRKLAPPADFLHDEPAKAA